MPALTLPSDSNNIPILGDDRARARARERGRHSQKEITRLLSLDQREVLDKVAEVGRARRYKAAAPAAAALGTQVLSFGQAAMDARSHPTFRFEQHPDPW